MRKALRLLEHRTRIWTTSGRELGAPLRTRGAASAAAMGCVRQLYFAVLGLLACLACAHTLAVDSVGLQAATFQGSERLHQAQPSIAAGTARPVPRMTSSSTYVMPVT